MDGAGDVQSKTVYGGSNPGTTSYGYDPAGELTSANTTGYTYTANGDRHTEGTRWPLRRRAFAGWTYRK